jgi:hypothetical protein
MYDGEKKGKKKRILASRGEKHGVDGFIWTHGTPSFRKYRSSPIRQFHTPILPGCKRGRTGKNLPMTISTIQDCRRLSGCIEEEGLLHAFNSTEKWNASLRMEMG